MGNGVSYRYNGGRTLKLGVTQPRAFKANMVLLCTTCKGPWSTVKNMCPRCSWKSNNN